MGTVIICGCVYVIIQVGILLFFSGATTIRKEVK